MTLLCAMHGAEGMQGDASAMHRGLRGRLEGDGAQYDGFRLLGVYVLICVVPLQ